MSVKITTDADMKAAIDLPAETLAEKLGTASDKQLEFFQEDNQAQSEQKIETPFTLDMQEIGGVDETAPTEGVASTNESITEAPELDETGVTELKTPTINLERQEKENQYIKGMYSKIKAIRDYQKSDKYDPKVLPKYLVTALDNMKRRAANSASIFKSLGLSMTGNIRWAGGQEATQKFYAINNERKQQGLAPLSIKEFQEQHPGILEERRIDKTTGLPVTDTGFVNIDNEGNVLNPDVPITRGSQVNLTAQAVAYHSQILNATVVDNQGNIDVDPDLPYIMSLAMEQFLVDEMFAAQKDLAEKGITPTQALHQRLNGDADKQQELFDEDPKSVVQEIEQIKDLDKLPTLKKTEMSEQVGRGVYQEWKRFQADKQGLPQDFYLRDYQELSPDVFVMLGDMVARLYSRANSNLFKELPEKVKRQTVFQITPEGILQFSRLRQGMPGLFSQPEVEPDSARSEGGHKVTEQAVLTRNMTSKVGSLTDLPGTTRHILDQGVENMNRTPYVNDLRREKIGLWSVLLAFNGHDVPIIGGGVDPNSFFAKQFKIGAHQLAALHNEKELLFLNAKMAEEAGHAEKADRLYKMAEEYNPQAILRENQEKFINVANAIQKYSGRENHLTFAIQALTGRIHAQQTLYNPQAHKLIRFIVGGGNSYQFTPNGNSETEKDWMEIMSAAFFEGAFKKQYRQARSPEERIKIFKQSIDSESYKQKVGWGNYLLENLENFDINNAKAVLKSFHSLAKAATTPANKEKETRVKGLIKQNFNNNFLANNPELMSYLDGHEEEIILIMDYLMDLAKWDQAKKAGTVHKTNIGVEIDGTTHGPATMAMALGSTAIAKRAGVLIPDATAATELMDFKDLRFAMADSMMDRFNLLLDGLEIPINQQPMYKEILKKAIEDTANFLKKSPMTMGYGQELESLKQYVGVTIKNSPVSKDIGNIISANALEEKNVIEFLHSMLVDSIYQTFDPETIQINQVLKTNAQLAILTDQPIKFVNSLGFTSWISGKESSLDERRQAHYTMSEPELRENPRGSLNIWHGTNEAAVLSNLAQRPFEGKDGRVYQSVEHAYQSHKSGKFDETTYSKPWKDGSKFVGKKAKTEKNYNINLMKGIIRQSFAQNPEAFQQLMNTKGMKLTHNQDKGVWGKEFPRILMDIRDEGGALTGLAVGKTKRQQSVELYRSEPSPAAIVERDGMEQVGRETAGGLLATVTQSKDGNMIGRTYTGNSWVRINTKAKERGANQAFMSPLFDASWTDLGTFRAVRNEMNKHHEQSLIESRDSEQILEWGNKQLDLLNQKANDDNAVVEIGGKSFHEAWRNLGIDYRGLRHIFPGPEARAKRDMDKPSKHLQTIIKRVMDLTPSEIVGKNKLMTVAAFTKEKNNKSFVIANRIESLINMAGYNLSPMPRTVNGKTIQPTTSLTKGDIKEILKIIVGPQGLDLKRRNDKALKDLKERRSIIINELKKQGLGKTLNVNIATIF